MLTRLVKIQLTIFTIVSIVGVLAMALVYVQAPTLLGIDHITVRMELPSGGGIYRFANVTYRGVQVGKVTAVDLEPDRVRATLSLDRSPRIPADLRAEVRSISAIGEQYVDLRPRHNAGPYLEDGSVIPVEPPERFVEQRAHLAFGDAVDQRADPVQHRPDRLRNRGALDGNYRAVFEVGSGVVPRAQVHILL
ncbi:MlaD family protein, partial [Mycobacterium sp. 1081908.1]|uniref:MlaD family protein n=1 Tax=Mycobacterium sp. 1081908.1 TaxID=1834066 RepID=UPI000A3F851A